MDKYGETITIEIVTGGFIVTYPIVENGVSASTAREVFNSPRKMQKKIKDLVSTLGLVADDTES